MSRLVVLLGLLPGCLVLNGDWDLGGESSSTAGDGETTIGASDSGSETDGSDSLGDGDGDGDGTTGDGDGTTGDGTTGDGDGDGDGTTGDGDGDGTAGDGDGDGTAGDGDGDGDGDGVALPGCGNGGPSFPGDLCYDPPQAVPLFPTAHPHFVAVADFDRDGWLDAASVDKFVDGAQMLSGDGSSLTSGAVYGMSDLPESLTAGDLNADGWPDLIIGRPVGTDTVGVLINDGAGGMGLQLNVVVGGDVRDVQLVDANLDASMDLAYVNVADDVVGILHGDGLGGFPTPPVEHSTSGSPNDLVVADANGDGRPDIVVVCLSGNVDVLPGLPGGSFGAAVSYPTDSIGNAPEGLAVADVDGDSDLDVAIIDRGADAMGILPNLGSGVLGTGAPLPVGSNPRAVGLGDVDADGDADMISADHDDGTFTLYLNDALGGFSLATTYAIGADPREIVLADLNADGADEMIASLHLDEAIGVIWSNP